MRKIVMLAVLYFSLFLSYSEATERTVLAEMYINTSCTYSAAAASLLDSIAMLYSDDLAIIRYHTWWLSPNDPFYTYNNSENTARTNYYDLDAIPSLIIDGITNCGTYNDYANYEACISSTMQVESNLELTLSGNFDSENYSGTVSVRLICTGNISDTNLKLRIAITESEIYYEAYNGRTIHQNTFRDMLPDTDGYSITLQQGDTLSLSFPFEYPQSLVPENGEIIAFVQSDDNKSVLQATRYSLLSLSGFTEFNLISPEDGTIALSDTIMLLWQSTQLEDLTDSIYYKTYIDNDPDFDSPITTNVTTDTTYTLYDSLEKSVSYYWRIVAYDLYNDSISSIETWNFYIDSPPTIPVIISPANGNQVDSATYLSWLTSTDLDAFDTLSYSIQIDDSPLFDSPEINVSGLANLSLVSDEAIAFLFSELEGFENIQIDQTYYWRVKADDAFGLNSNFTDGTNYFVYGIDYNDPPSPPALGFSPAGDEEIISLSPTITWNNATDPNPDDHQGTLIYYFHLLEDTLTGSYEYFDTTDQGVNQVVITDEIPDNSHFRYYITTVDDEGLQSGESAIQWFWTNHYNYPPEPFSLNLPDAEQRWVDYYTTFTWGSTIDYDPLSSFDYTLQISSDSLFNELVLIRTGITDTFITITTDSLVNSNGDFYWQVYATDDDGLVRFGGLPESENRKLTVVQPGDANGDGIVLGGDVVYLVNYFRGINPAPDPLLTGDVSGDCMLLGGDVTYLVNYFRGLNPQPVRGNCQ